MDLLNKKIMVVGMARSGMAAAILLCKQGALPLLVDSKPKEAFNNALDMLEPYPVRWHLGEEPENFLREIDGVVISPGVPIQAPFVTTAKEMGLPVIGELELAYQNAKGTLVAVTGTNGKTTTVSLLGEMFKNAGKLTHVVGNIGYPYSAAAVQSKLEDVVVAEVSSFQLESVETLHPRVSAILNITPDHLNRHQNMETYIALKQRIFENQNRQDSVVLNWEDPLLREMGLGIKHTRVLWFSARNGLTSGAYAQGGKIFFANKGEKTLIGNVDDVFIPGEHNLENALAAVAIAMDLEVPPPVIRHSLRTFPGVEHRIERVREKDGITYINDSKGTNIDATIKAVQAMKNPTVIILGGYDKKSDFSALAEEIKGHTSIIGAVLIGTTAQEIEKALKKTGFSNLAHGATMEEAVKKAGEMAQIGGNVLLSPACASFDMFEDYEQRGRIFKQIVEALL